MANAVEIEAKVLLDDKEYEHLLKKLPLKQHVIQTNWYIDSADRELEHASTRMGLRIRFVNGEYTLTLKAPMAEGLLEKEELLGPSEAEQMIKKDLFPKGGIADFLGTLDVDVKKLKTLAKLETERYYGLVDKCKVSLDKNTYLGKVDYELEVDSDSMGTAQKEAKEILKGRKVEFNSLSKQARALNALEGPKK